MQHLVYPRERTLGTITLVLGLIGWLLLIAGTFGIALLVLLIGFVIYLFAQSTLIAHIKGNGVQLSEEQFPELYAQFVECCDTLQIQNRPQVYILNGDGGMNAFATRFLSTQYVVLLSDVVNAMDKHEDGVRFYLGHELGHLRMNHLRGQLFRWPVLWLPLLGAAYSRARESTCDRHGLACCSTPEGAVRALTALAAGSERWQDIDVAAYLRQIRHTSGFWMSFHELTAGYPWLSKRAARVMDPQATMPSRSVWAWLLSIFVPYAGRMGAGFGLLIVVYIIGVMAAIAIPQFNEYQSRSRLLAIVHQANMATLHIGNYYEAEKHIPPSLKEAGVSAALSDGSTLSLDQDTMVLTVSSKMGQILFVPEQGADGSITWTCRAGEGLKPAQLPRNCKREES